MIYRTLGKTNIKISAIGFGCWQIGGALSIAGKPFSYGEVDENSARRAIKTALSLGVNFFDTADFYGLGKSEYLLGEELGNEKNKVIIGSKVGCVPDGLKGCDFDASYFHIIASCERSLKRLGREYLDVYLLHFIPEDEKLPESVEALCKLKKEGKIREFGISIANNFNKLTSLVDCFSIVEGYYNLLFRDFEKYEDIIKDKNIGFIAASPLSRGILSGRDYNNVVFSDSDIRKKWKEDKAQVAWFEQQDKKIALLNELSKEVNIPLKNIALSYLLTNNYVSAIIPGIKSESHLLGITESLNFLPLDRKILSAIESALKS